MQKVQDGPAAVLWRQPALFLLDSSNYMKEKMNRPYFFWTVQVNISQYFEELRADYIGAYYGMYFLEIADYYTRENNDEREMLKLLYQSMRALLAPSLPNKLVKCIYELKTLAVNGEYPGVPADRELNESTVYALRFIEEASVERLYTFLVKDEVLTELAGVAALYRRRFMDKQFKSLEILETLC